MYRSGFSRETGPVGRMSVCGGVCPCVCIHIFIYTSIDISGYLYQISIPDIVSISDTLLYLCIYLSTFGSTYVSMHLSSIYISMYLSLYLLSISLLSLYRSAFFCVSMYLYVSLAKIQIYYNIYKDIRYIDMAK